MSCSCCGHGLARWLQWRFNCILFLVAGALDGCRAANCAPTGAAVVVRYDGFLETSSHENTNRQGVCRTLGKA